MDTKPSEALHYSWYISLLKSGWQLSSMIIIICDHDVDIISIEILFSTSRRWKQGQYYIALRKNRLLFISFYIRENWT